MMPGGWSEYRPLAEQERMVFFQATREYVGVQLEPVLVSSQTVSGTNYRYVCNAMTTGNPPRNFIAQATVYDPLRGNAALQNVCEMRCRYSGRPQPRGRGAAPV